MTTIRPRSAAAMGTTSPRFHAATQQTAPLRHSRINRRLQKCLQHSETKSQDSRSSTYDGRKWILAQQEARSIAITPVTPVYDTTGTEISQEVGSDALVELDAGAIEQHEGRACLSSVLNVERRSKKRSMCIFGVGASTDLGGRISQTHLAVGVDQPCARDYRQVVSCPGFLRNGSKGVLCDKTQVRA